MLRKTKQKVRYFKCKEIIEFDLVTDASERRK